MKTVERESQELERRLDTLEAKLDRILQAMEANQRRSREWRELSDDLGRIAKDVFQVAVVELEKVSEHFEARDLAQLLLRLLRNVRNLTRWMEHLESASDLGRDLGPIARDAFHELLERLDRAEQRGYFLLAREAARRTDSVVASMSDRELRALAAALPEGLRALAAIQRSGAFETVRAAVEALAEPAPTRVGWRDLVRRMGRPETRRGLARLLAVAAALGEEDESHREPEPSNGP
jgi:uncharacterized protein YjgD (DUF1641 family)